MTIGVIITVYNLEKFVNDAIRSVLRQTNRATKIIVVNDGSSDGSLKKILEFGNDVTLVNNGRNQGVLPSIITAMNLLDTDVIAFLDGDDIWYDTKLEEIRKIFEAHSDAMLVTHSYEWINASGKLVGTIDETHKNLQRIVAQSHGDIQQRDILLRNSILCYKGVWLGSALCIKRSFLNIFEFERWSTQIWGHNLSHQDQPLAAYMIYKNPNAKIFYVEKVLFQYRVFGENSSGNTGTVEKALHTLSRSKATLLRTLDTVRKMPEKKEELNRQENKLLEIRYLECVYKNKRISSVKLFCKLWKNLWNDEQKIKELKRLISVSILGIRYFLRLKGHLKSHIQISN